MAATEYARRTRDEKAKQAARIGIDEALISALVETFYTRIRAHARLGPIFEAHVEDWPSHLGRMKDFWASIAIESGRFHGNPMVKHIAIGSLERGHFDEWLTLFNATLDDVVAPVQARAFFRDRAAHIADSLHMGIEIQRSGLNSRRKNSGKEKS